MSQLRPEKPPLHLRERDGLRRLHERDRLRRLHERSGWRRRLREWVGEGQSRLAWSGRTEPITSARFACTSSRAASSPSPEEAGEPAGLPRRSVPDSGRGSEMTMQLPRPFAPYTSWPVRLDAEIKKLGADPELAALLEQRGIGSLQVGGCAILAEAVRQALGPRARVIGVRETHSPFIEHAAVECGGWYIDALGVREGEQFIADLHAVGGYREPFLVWFRPCDGFRRHIPYYGVDWIISGLAADLARVIRG